MIELFDPEVHILVLSLHIWFQPSVYNGMFTNILAQSLEKTWTLFGICWFSCLNANKTNTFRSVFLSNLGFNSGVFLSTGYRRSGSRQGGGGGVDWVATQPPLEQPLKNIMRGEKKTEIHGSQKPCEANQPQKCNCHRSKCGLSEICGAAPQTNDGVFTFGRLGQ